MPLERVQTAQEWIERFGGSRRPSVLTIGNFDGMHRGHQEILKRVVASAQEKQCMPAVLTFFPHPVSVLRPSDAPPMLATLDQRLAAFERAGIEAALVLRFDEALSRMSAEEFVAKYLAETMRAREVMVVENFRFGHKQQGDVTMLRSLGQHFGFGVEIVESLRVDATVVSSTAVRAALNDGRVDEANRLLGHPFALTGVIQTGTGQGRKLVVPTLNLKTDQGLLPKRGVYVTDVRIGTETFPAVTNVGYRPTFNGANVTVESHLFGFDRDLTAGDMEVYFLSRLRDEQKFPGIGALREQVLHDIEKAKEFHRTRITDALNS
jgi:riboflavin kinase/FMN adenylyltransferase